MKQFIFKNKKAIAGITAILLIGAITMSFQDSPFAYNKFAVQEEYDMPYCAGDTVPEKDYNGTMKMKDFDKLQHELDRSMLQVSEEMKKMDLAHIQEEIEASLKSIDMDKIMRDVELSLKQVDLDKMLASVSSSLKDIELDINHEDIDKAMIEAKKEIEKAKLEVKEIDREKIRKELQKAKREIEKSRVEIDKIDVDKIMNEARTGIEKAKEELKLTREMFNELEKDGLIDSKKGFELEYKNKSLYIDGKKQSEKVTDKYRKYFKDEHFKIKIGKE